MNQTRLSTFNTVVGFALLTFSFAGVGLAQNTNSGDIRGTVMDSTGAIVPGAAVTILDTDTGVAKELVTNQDGIYDAVSLVPGKYRLTFSKEGFGKLVREGIDLRVGVITVDAQLNVGAASQEVNISAEATLLKTETGEQSTSLQTESMMQLPNVGENWANFTKLLPGAQGSGTGISVNGNLPYYSSFLADGGNTTLPHSANVDVSTFEIVSEVQIQTSTFSAQYGVGGVVFNQISKSGTNQLHGAAYEYVQNNFFNARSFFSPKVQIQRYNNYGGSLGGPIIKNKMFAYFNLDRLHNTSTAYPFSTFPTAAMRSGDFSDPIFPKIYDPATLTVVNGVATRQPFPGNVIPPNRIDPLASKLQSYFPNPNLSGFANNWIGSLTSSSPLARYFGRLDYNPSDTNRVTFSMLQRDNPNVTPAATCPINCYYGDVDSQSAQISDVWTISPTIVNEARFAYSREDDHYTPFTVGAGYPAKLGLNYAKADIFPDVTIGGPVGGTSFTAGPNAIYAESTFTPSDVLTMIKGKHILKFGGEFQMAQDNATPWGNIQSAQLTFNGVFTKQTPADSKSGLGYADFLLGQVSSWGATNSPIVGARMKTPQVFVQDDFKVLPNLTVNLGLRYELHRGWREIGQRLGTFDPTIKNPATNTLGAMWFQGDNGRDALEAPVNVWLPRVGFAWTPVPKWAVRGGFGIYSYGWSIDTYSGGSEGVGANSTGSLSNTDRLQPVFIASNPNPPLNYIGASRLPDALNGHSVNYVPYHTPVARNYQWSFSIQRELPWSMVAEGAYVGSHGTGLSFPVDINQVPVNLLGADNPQSRRPFPQFLGISGNNYNGISNYDSMQLSMRKRFRTGVSFDVNYTWSKFLDDQDSAGWGGRGGSQYYQNAYAPLANYSLSNLDVPHMFKGDVVYQLPVGKGKTFLNQNGFLDALLGGWQASATFIFESGTPFTPLWGGANLSGALAGNWYPNVVGNPRLDSPTLSQWYNTGAFAQAAPFTFGNAGRNILRGPRMSDVDFSMGKNFAIPRWESARLQIRIDATNALNHPSFSNPNNNIGTPNAGIITGTTVGGRNLQLGARLSF